MSATLIAETPQPVRSILRPIGMGLIGLLALIVLVLVGFRAAAVLRERATPEAAAPKTGKFIATPSGRMFVLDEGPRDGIPVVLIHGTAAWSEFWRGTIDELVEARYRVIALDLPPFGFSDRGPVESYTRAEQSRRIVGVLDGLSIDKAILVGHSFGAGATVETVIRNPDRIRGLVLVAAALGLPQEGTRIEPPSPLLMGVLGLPVLPEAVISATATNPLVTRQLLATMIARKDAATP